VTSPSPYHKLRQAARRRSVEANIFPAALPALDTWEDFRWHTESSGASDSYKEHSSQALAVDVFGSLQASPNRDLVLARLAQHLNLPSTGPWQIQLEWHDPDNLLCERQPSWIDAVAFSPHALIFFECKFTESDGGSCSQTQPVKRGRHKGLKPCNGAYMQQVNPVNHKDSFCALTAKGIRYWDLIPQVFNIPAELGYLPCPFAGPWFQWMRNLTIGWAVAQHRHLQPAFVLVYADGPTLPMAARLRSSDWTRFTQTLKSNTIAVHTLSFQALITLAQQAVPTDSTWADLHIWVARKIDSVCRARQIHAADSPP
jgi:hypothetical protein